MAINTLCSADIVTLPSVSGDGHDKIVGDLHGSLTCFNRVLASLKLNDRLFLVGDLIDRGEDSPGIIQAIINFQKIHPWRLYAVRGNHESLCLQAIQALERLTPADPVVASDFLPGDQSNLSDWINMTVQLPTLNLNDLNHHEWNPDQALSDLYNHVMNGGDWLINLYSQEFLKGLIHKNAEGIHEYSPDSQVKVIKEFIMQLPYILHIEAQRPFNIVHADMPFDDSELMRKIDQGEASLSANQKEYATWFREKKRHETIANQPLDITGRNTHSSITYVGHSIIAYGDAPVIRAHTNTIDLDVATYINNISLVVDHTAGTCEFIGMGLDKVKGNIHLQEAQNELSAYLKTQKTK